VQLEREDEIDIQRYPGVKGAVVVKVPAGVLTATRAELIKRKMEGHRPPPSGFILDLSEVSGLGKGASTVMVTIHAFASKGGRLVLLLREGRGLGSFFNVRYSPWYCELFYRCVDSLDLAKDALVKENWGVRPDPKSQT